MCSVFRLIENYDAQKVLAAKLCHKLYIRVLPQPQAWGRVIAVFGRLPTLYNGWK